MAGLNPESPAAAVKIELLPFRKEFLASFLLWRHQAASVRHNPLRQMGPGEVLAMLESEGSDPADLGRYTGFRWFMGLDGHVVGQVSLRNVNHMMRYAEIGYGVSEVHQGQGIATAAVRLLVDLVFSRSDLRKLIAHVHDRNAASCRVLEKLGFTREGLLREHYLINGVPENEILYGVLKHEWRVDSRA